jgi:aminoglycoside 6'-N-acetyltransferase I
MTKNLSDDLTIGDLTLADGERIEQAARLLVLGFKADWPDAWPDLEAALDEVNQSLAEGRISRVAVHSFRGVVGWIAGISQHNGQSWELHPLVVHPDFRGKGIGTALVRDFEDQVQSRNGAAIWLGTDDETEMTTLGGIDLYPDVLNHLARVKNLRRHPFEFYQKAGFSLVGVIPDANGPGKPDIMMAKRVQRR